MPHEPQSEKTLKAKNGPPAVVEIPIQKLDRAEVRWAGKQLIRRQLVWTEEAAPETLRIFGIANAWRDLHELPMVRVRTQIIGQLRRLQLRGNTTAARLKRLPSIKKKLQTRYLDVIQDLAGVRVIVPTMQDVERMTEACRIGLQHTIWEEDDYIANPRPSGYRSQHLKLEYKPGNRLEEICDGCRVELQIRTRRQHGWATANEAVGLFRGEALKNGKGSPNWQRLFVLMASEIARIEGRSEVPSAPDHAERVRELRDLNELIGAARFLDGISQAVHFTDQYVRPESSEVYLIRFDLETHEVNVVGYNSTSGARSYHATEAQEDRYDAVLVTSDKISNLKKAFPNYFGDTKMFARTLRQIIKGKDVPEYILPKQEIVKPPPRILIDTTWLRRSTQSKDPLNKR